MRCTKSVLFNKYVLLCRYRLIKKGCKCIATQHPSNQNNIVCFCKTATKKQIIRLILMLRLNDAALVKTAACASINPSDTFL